MIDPVYVIGCANCLKIQERLKNDCTWKQLKKEFKYVNVDILKAYVKRIRKTQNNYLYDEISNRY